MSKTGYYFIIINVLGFLLYLINLKTKNKLNPVVTLIAMAGGSAGILLSVLCFDRKAEKENMMIRVLAICMLVIYAVAILMLKGHRADTITYSIWKPFMENKWLLIYFAAINLVTFTAFALDKFKAVKNKSRIKIVTLLVLSFIGGSVGGFISMHLFHHKTKKNYFTVGLPLIMLTQIAVIFYILNAGW